MSFRFRPHRLVTLSTPPARTPSRSTASTCRPHAVSNSIAPACLQCVVRVLLPQTGSEVHGSTLSCRFSDLHFALRQSAPAMRCDAASAASEAAAHAGPRLADGPSLQCCELNLPCASHWPSPRCSPFPRTEGGQAGQQGLYARQVGGTAGEGQRQHDCDVRFATRRCCIICSPGACATWRVAICHSAHWLLVPVGACACQAASAFGEAVSACDVSHTVFDPIVLRLAEADVQTDGSEVEDGEEKTKDADVKIMDAAPTPSEPGEPPVSCPPAHLSDVLVMTTGVRQVCLS